MLQTLKHDSTPFLNGRGIDMSDWGKIIFNRQRGRYAVVGSWQGQRLHISQYLTIPCVHLEVANRLLSAIRTDIDKGIFNPNRYKRSKPLHLGKYSDRWLEDVKPDLSSGTWAGYETAVRLYIKPCLGDRFLPDIGHPDLKKLMKSLKHLSAKTKKNIFGALHKMMKDAHRDGYISQIPPWIEFRGENEVMLPPIEYLTVENQIKIVEHISIQHRPIFLFGMGTGCRPSEARALRKQDIHDDYILFTSAFGYHGELKSVKAKKAEPFPIYPELRDILSMAPKTLLPWVFPNPDTGRHYSKEINRIWNKACDDAGVKRIRLYQAFRHSYACQLLNSGVEKAVVSKLLRHSDPRMVERYAKYEVASLERAAGKVRRLR
jgi:integrase